MKFKRQKPRHHKPTQKIISHLVSSAEDAVAFADEAVVLLEIISVGVFIIILCGLVFFHHQTVCDIVVGEKKNIKLYTVNLIAASNGGGDSRAQKK